MIWGSGRYRRAGGLGLPGRSVPSNDRIKGLWIQVATHSPQIAPGRGSVAVQEFIRDDALNFFWYLCTVTASAHYPPRCRDPCLNSIASHAPPRIPPPEQAFNDYYLEAFDALE